MVGLYACGSWGFFHRGFVVDGLGGGGKHIFHGLSSTARRLWLWSCSSWTRNPIVSQTSEVFRWEGLALASKSSKASLESTTHQTHH